MRVSRVALGILLAGVLVVSTICRTTANAQANDELLVLRERVVKLYHAGKYNEAVPMAERGLALAERRYGTEHPTLGTWLSALGLLYTAQGRNAEAEAAFKRDIAVTEKALGPKHQELAISLNNMAMLYHAQGRYAEAEPLYRRSFAIMEKVLKAGHPNLAQIGNNLGELHRVQGNYAEAEQLYKSSIAIFEKMPGSQDQNLAQSLNNLALVRYAQGQYQQAESLYKRAIAIADRTLGVQHPAALTYLNNLAMLYQVQGRHAEAEALHRRSLSIREKALGLEHPDVAQSLNNLALLHLTQRRYADAEPLLLRALAISEKKMGPNHFFIGTVLNNLAIGYQAQNRYGEAEALLRRSLDIREKALGPTHPDIGQSLNNLAFVNIFQGRFTEAEPFLMRALAITESALGPDHPDVSLMITLKGALAILQGNFEAALELQRRGSAISIKHANLGTDSGESGKRELTQVTDGFRFHVLAADLSPRGRSSLVSETFEMAQWALQSGAADALAQMSVRFAAKDGALAQTVRERQDLVRRWQVADGHLAAAASKGDSFSANTSRKSIAEIEARLRALDQQLAKNFSNYAALAQPKPLDIAAAQAMLKEDEALIVLLDVVPSYDKLPEAEYAWVVTKTAARWLKLTVTPTQVEQHVAALRCGLDHTLWLEAADADKCKAALKAGPREEIVKTADGDVAAQLLPFSAQRSHDLYTALLRPFEDLIRSKHLLIVPAGHLTSLPFHVLVVEPPKTAIPASFTDYRSVAWLGARQPITVLPSVASLQTLRQLAKTSQATKPYLGVGNPLLEGSPERNDDRKRAREARDKQQCQRSLATQHLASIGSRAPVGFAKLFRGGQVDIEKVKLLPPLPEAADELCEVGRRLGVPESEIILGARATETRLKELSSQGRLADYAIVHFATHGALSGQVRGSAEPGLILTPPGKVAIDAKAVDRDDGFLTASEIANLKLDADWVVLSACNTAGAQNENAEALSGMARAFFYAGARALLVSHWEVASDAAVKLTTRAFAAMKADPRIGRAEAMRLSMRELIEKGSPLDGHPSQWAPFVVVGEGAR